MPSALEEVCEACGVPYAPNSAKNGGIFAVQDETSALRRERGLLRQQQQLLREAQLLSETCGGRKLAQAHAFTRHLESVAQSRDIVDARLRLAVDPHALFVSPPERQGALRALLANEMGAHAMASAEWARAARWARAGTRGAATGGGGASAERLVNSMVLNQLRVQTAGQQRLQVATQRLQTAQLRLAGGY